MRNVARTFCFAIVAVVASGALSSFAQAQDVLRIGGDPNFRPIGFMNEKGEPVGYDIDFGKALAERLNMTYDYNGMAFDGLIPALTSGRIDMMSSFAVTEQRKQVIAYSQPVLAQRIVLIVPKEHAGDPSIEELKSWKVGVQVNSSAAATLERLGVPATTYNTLPDELNDVILGRIQAVAVEGVAGYYAVAATHPDKLRVSTILSTDPVFIASAMRKEDTELHQKVDAAITAMKQDGTLEAITKKWFGDAQIIAE